MNNGETVLITGASRGIGRAIARKTAKEGGNVVVNYHESHDEAQNVVSEIKELGADAIAIQADVAEIEEVKSLATQAAEFGDGVDHLVNNAGAILRPADWKNIDDQTWHRTIDVNLKGVFNCTREIAPEMVKQGRGKIVNISSTWGFLGAAPIAAYTAAKAGVINLTRSFAPELAPEVTINTVAFSTIDTEMTRSAGEEFVQHMIEQTPMNRLGTPKEAADAVHFLLSESSDFITGETLNMDGGYRFQ